MLIEKKTHFIVYLITCLVIWLVVSIPFSAFKGEFFNPDEGNPVIVILNRTLILLVMTYCFFSMISSKKFLLELYSFTTLSLILFYVSCLGVFYNVMYGGSFLNLSDIIFITSLFIITTYLIEYNISKILLPAITIILLFYGLDIIIQSVVGYNLLGYPTGHNRNWGFFIYGSPAPGYFLVMLFFIPFFYLKGLKRILFYTILTAAVFLTGDRGPLLQLLFSVFLGLIFIERRYFLSIFLISIIGLSSYFAKAYDLLPYRYNNFVDALSYYKNKGLDKILHDFANLNDDSVTTKLNQLNLVGYFEKYHDLYYKWFTFENIIYIFTGAGLGSSDIVLSELVGFGRPHNFLIEVVIILGLIPSVLFFILTVIFLKNSKKYAFIILPTLTPFINASMTSFNFVILIFLQILCIYQYQKYHLQHSIQIKK